MIYIKTLLFLLCTTFTFADNNIITSSHQTHETLILEKPCHTLNPVAPYQLKKMENNQGYQYFFDNNPLYLILKILLVIVIIIYRDKLSSLPLVINFSLLLFVPIFLLYSAFLEWKVIKQDEIRLFDTYKRVYYQQANHGDKELKYYTSFDEIKAIQLLNYKECWKQAEGGSKTCEDVYELNLVLNNNSRINLEKHKDYSTINKNASTLKKVLKKPIFSSKEK